jgi:hypothetical protein
MAAYVFFHLIPAALDPRSPSHRLWRNTMLQNATQIEISAHRNKLPCGPAIYRSLTPEYLPKPVQKLPSNIAYVTEYIETVGSFGHGFHRARVAERDAQSCTIMNKSTQWTTRRQPINAGTSKTMGRDTVNDTSRFSLFNSKQTSHMPIGHVHRPSPCYPSTKKGNMRLPA